jgi:hypothetical protein
VVDVRIPEVFVHPFRPLADDLDDAALEALLFEKAPAPTAEHRPVPDWAYVHNELRRPGVTLMLLWVEYREAHPGGYAYSQFAHHYRRWRGHLDLVMRQDHRAGEKCFVDFPGQRLAIYDRRSGEVAFGAELFVAVLGASSYLYAEAVRSQDLQSFVTAHVHAFDFFGAVPRVLVPDNLRSAVNAPHRYEPTANATYQEMAAPLRGGRHPDEGEKAPQQGQGGIECPARRALDPGPPAQPTLLLPGRGQRLKIAHLVVGDQRPAVQKAPPGQGPSCSGPSSAWPWVPCRPPVTSSPAGGSG